jgi:hypothetical protein
MVISAGDTKQANMGLMLLPDPRPSHFCSIVVEFLPHRSPLASDLPDAIGNIHPKSWVTNRSSARQPQYGVTYSATFSSFHLRHAFMRGDLGCAYVGSIWS